MDLEEGVVASPAIVSPGDGNEDEPLLVQEDSGAGETGETTEYENVNNYGATQDNVDEGVVAKSSTDDEAKESADIEVLKKNSLPTYPIVEK